MGKLQEMKQKADEIKAKVGDDFIETTEVKSCKSLVDLPRGQHLVEVKLFSIDNKIVMWVGFDLC